MLINGKQSTDFKITTGVLQGDVLAPFLFIMVIDHVMRNSAKDFGFVYELAKPSSRYPAKKINDLDFADDIALLENNTQRASEQINTLSEEATKVGLNINIDKTEVMLFNIKNEAVKLNGQELKTVQDFKYLGAHMESTLSDVNSRRGQAIGAFNKLNKIWKARHLPINLKTQILQASVFSIFLYGCEAWTINDKLEANINSFAINCYHTILGTRRTDRIRNETILQMVGMQPLIEKVRERQLGWLGHTLRLNSQVSRANPLEPPVEDPAKTFALYVPAHGKYKPGPRQLSYRHQMAILVSDTPDLVTNENIEELAKNKTKWSNIVAAYGPIR